jgi:hypothetical protein
MNLVLSFDNLPPMPTNRAKTLVSKPRPMYIKTPLAREFEKDVISRLEKNKERILNFVSSFDKKIHYLSAEYILFTPLEILFTKEGAISNRAGDLDSHKLLQDTIFSFMGLDDKLVREVRYRSVVSNDDKHNIQISYKLEEILCLRNTYTLTQSTTKQQSQDLTWSALL